MLASVTNRPLKSQWHNMKKGLFLFHVLMPRRECGFFLSGDLRVQVPFICFYLQGISLSLSLCQSLSQFLNDSSAVLGKRIYKGILRGRRWYSALTRTWSQCFSLTAREASEGYFSHGLKKQKQDWRDLTEVHSREESFPSPAASSSCRCWLPAPLSAEAPD